MSDNPVDEQVPVRSYQLLIALALAGLFIGGLMTHHHDVMSYSATAQVGQLIGCEATEGVNCDVVNTSAYAEVFDIPIATLALPAYVLVLVLALIGLRRRSREPLALLVALGLGMSLYSVFLFYISKVELGNLCSWCLRNYGVTFAVLGVSLFAGGLKPPRVSLSLLRSAALWLVASSLVAVAGERALRHSLLGDQPVALAAKADATKVSSSDEGGVLEAQEFEAFAIGRRNQKVSYGSVAVGPNTRWRGNPEAEVTVIEYADLECPICRNAAHHFDRLFEAYGDRVLFAFKHFPINKRCNEHVKRSKHAYACIAAKAAECAGDQGKFWPYISLAFRNQHNLGARSLSAHAAGLGLDRDRFRQCLRTRGVPAGVLRDTAELGGLEKMRKSTPKVLINGELYLGGVSAEGLAKSIEAALLKVGQGGASKSAEFMRKATQPIPADVPAMRAVRYGATSFSIDTFEAGRGEDGKAISADHTVPVTGASWHEAKATCEAAGKRLCTAAEWLTACQGAEAKDDNGNGRFADDALEGSLQPYGDVHRPKLCWDGHRRDAYRPVYTGEHPGCVSRDGVYDLTGNVAEWVGDSEDKAVLMGGMYEDRRPSCVTANFNWGPDQSAIHTGIRCCADAEVTK
jgi:protein-disulfide isomerase/uncharacterized membrane protein